MHFSDEIWTDFVRGVASTPKAREIQTHLSDGCTDCLDGRDLWDGLRLAGINEMTYAPPNGLVRQLKLQFTSATFGSSAEAVMPVFDSFLQALPGFRSGSAIPRQLLYEGEGVTVDLRLEQPPRSRTIFATGQVLNKRIPHSTLSEGRITLWTMRGLPIVETTPNAQGEFQLEFEAQENLHLSIALCGYNPLRIVLPQLHVL